ncbi:MAG: outer membrane beta-barrel protein [Saprospiraceae bacterium]|nr:outer membrane beta-barrel protein [Saprospiraceae bacterium]
MKYLISIFLILFFLQTSFAQNSIAIKGGIGTSMIYFKNSNRKIDLDFIATQHFGISKKIAINNTFDLLLDLQWSNKGGKLIFENSYSTVNFSYLSLPIYLNYKLNQFRFGFGVDPSVKLYTRVNGLFLDAKQIALFENTFSNNVDISLFTNQTFEWRNFFIENRIGLGLLPLTNNNITDENGQDLLVSKTGKNIWLQLSLGYFFR